MADPDHSHAHSHEHGDDDGHDHSHSHPSGGGGGVSGRVDPAVMKRSDSRHEGLDGEYALPGERSLLVPVMPVTERDPQHIPANFTPPASVLLDGESLSAEDLWLLSRGETQIDLAPEAWDRVRAARQVVDDVVASGVPTYGINTGFGNFSDVSISEENLVALQENLIRSHAAGIGDPLPHERVRMLLALRINVLAKGFSGISEDTLRKVIAGFNASCLSFVPERGTVGASGDLAPLSHLALGLLGEGKMWDAESETWGQASEILERNNLTPLSLKAKEGLALINGTQMMTALGAEAVCRARRVLMAGTVAAAMTLEALKGTAAAFDPRIHKARPHRGQNLVAKWMRALLHRDGNESEVASSHANCGRVQDAYTLRCIPQVFGVALETIEFVTNIIETEMNSATDNPMIFAESGDIISGGNFHGEFPAKALDYLAIGIHEVANMSERRIERLCNTDLNEELPPFLTPNGGLNSGFMIAHCTAAALVSENKVLTHPSSVDSISTSAGKEDHVSMGGFAARKCLQVIEHVEGVVAIELLAACQGVDFHRPLKTTPALEAVHELVRSVADKWEGDRFMSPDIEAVAELVRLGKVVDVVYDYLRFEGGE